MINLLLFLRTAIRAYRGALKGTGSHYAAITHAGVPQVAVFVGIGREAWRVSQRAIVEFDIK